MTVSVVIATYNRADMVRQAIQAALGQSRPPDEIVVVDDASTDSTPETLRELAAADSRLRVFRRSVNSGGVPVWNEAAARARGDLIAFCTDDDRFLPGHLEASLEYLDLHPEAGLVHSSFIDALESEVECSFEPRPFRCSTPLKITSANLIPYLARFYDWPFHPSTLVLRRGVWTHTGGMNPSYALADTDWFIRAVEQFPAVMLPRHGVYNRRHPGNWSNRLGSARMQREIFEIVEALIDRKWGKDRLRRNAWKFVWRSDVRLHLLLTLLARLKTGHGDAACSAWRGILQDTGRHSPAWLEHAGSKVLHWFCRGREVGRACTRKAVTPL